MSEYGAFCKLCHASGDYCGMSFGAGFRCDIDCRMIVDAMTDAQIKEIHQMYEDQREIRESALRDLHTLEDELGITDYGE